MRTVTPRDNRRVALFQERPGSDPMSPPLRAMRWLDAEGREIARQEY